MRVIIPLGLTDAMLTASNAAEPGPLESVWSATALYATGNRVYIGSPTSSVTITNASPAVVAWASHNLIEGTPLVLTTTGTLPAGLSPNTIYYVKDTPTTGTLTLSSTLGGAPINTSSAGSGTHTATAQVHRVYEALVGQTSAVTITIAAPGVVNYPNHNFALNTQVIFTTTGALPTGIVAGQAYYAIPVDSANFQLANTVGGSALTTSGTQSGVHTCGLATNYGKPPLLNLFDSSGNALTWADAGPTNRWAMFDTRRTNPTVLASPLQVSVTPGQRCDSIALLGLVATSVQITVSSGGGGGLVYDSGVIDLSTRQVANWYDYFFKPFTFKNAVARFMLPPYTDAVISVTVTSSAGSVSCGAMVIGIGQDLGQAQDDAESGRVNFSTVTRDAFGNGTFQQEENIPTTKQEVWADKSLLNGLEITRDALNGVPAVYAAVEDDTSDFFQALLILGFYRDWVITVKGPTQVTSSIRLEEI